MESPSEQLRLRPHNTAANSPSGGGDEETIAVSKRRRNLLFRRLCGGCAAITLINVVVSVILVFTVFKTKQPVVQIHKLWVLKLDMINGTNTTRPGSNATLLIDVSIKNRNFVSMSYPVMASTIHYRGVVVGDAISPPGTQRARRTMRTNVTMEVIVDRFKGLPGLDSDMKTGVFDLTAYSRFRGRAKIFFIKMHVKVKMKCAATVNFTSLKFLHLKCKPKFKLIS